MLLLSVTFFVCSSPTYAKYLVSTSVENTVTFEFVALEDGGTFYTASRSGSIADNDVYHIPAWKPFAIQQSILLCFNNYSSSGYDIEIETQLRKYNGLIDEDHTIYMGVYLEDNQGNRVLCGINGLNYFEAWNGVYDYYCGTISGHTSTFITTNNGSALISGDYQNVFIEYLQKNTDNTYSIYSDADVLNNTTLISLKVYVNLHA